MPCFGLAIAAYFPNPILPGECLSKTIATFFLTLAIGVSLAATPEETNKKLMVLVEKSSSELAEILKAGISISEKHTQGKLDETTLRKMAGDHFAKNADLTISSFGRVTVYEI